MSISANYPNVRPSLLLDFANSQQLDPRVTFSRSTTAPYYDGKTSVLAEQNLALYSQDYTNAVWTKGNVTIGATTTAPDGTSTGLLMYPNSTGTFRWVYQSKTSPAGIYTWSLIAKAQNKSWGYIDLTGAGTVLAFFNFSTGTVGTVASGYTGSFQNLGSGWYRFIVTSNTSVSALSFAGVYGVSDADASTTVTANATDGIYLWGSQVENRNAVTAYNATTTLALTNYIPQLLTAPINAPRFDFNPTTGESLGLLIEQSSTNLQTYSQDFSNAAWTKSNATITPTANIAPDGTQTMQLYVPNNGATIGAGTNLYKSVTLAAGSIALSVYAKAKELTTFTLQDGSGNGGNFNLSTITATNVGTAVATITSVGNGVYRCVATIASTGTNPYWFFYPSAGTANGYNGIYIWGSQLEALAFPTSYIPTTSAQVTRAIDNASMTGTNFSSWYNNAQGSWYSEFIPMVTTGNSRAILQTNQYSMYIQTGASVGIYDGTNAAINGIATNNALNKAITTYATNKLTSCLNGISPTVVNAYNNLFASSTIVTISGGNLFNGWVKKVSFNSQAPTSAQQQALTGS
jgi:hypothetical protein